MSKEIKIELKTELNLRKDFKPIPYQDWREIVEKNLKGISFDEKLTTQTYEGITLQPLYQENQLDDPSSFPGKGNFKRGIKISGYLKESWGIVQNFLLTKDPSPINSIIRAELKRGLSVIKISPPEGVDFSNFNKDYFKIMFKGVDLTKYPLIFSKGYEFSKFLKLLISYLKGEKINIKEVVIIFNIDPIAYLIKEGQLPKDMESVLDDMALALKWTKENNWNFRLIGIDSSPYHNSGASIVQQSAYLMAGAIFYIDQMLRRNLDIETVANSINFNLEISPLFFMEMANIRALRIVWAKLIKVFQGSVEAQKIFLNAKISSYFQTLLDPYVNILRSTTESLSAILAGVDNLEVDRFSKIFFDQENEDEFARRVARNIQLILREESHFDRLIDPGGGSYYVEELTKNLAQNILEKFKEIEGKGGILNAIKEGVIQTEIECVAKKRVADLKSRRKVVVGTNRYVNLMEELNDLPKPVRIQESKDKESLNNPKISGKLIVPKVFIHRLAHPFEELRLQVERYQKGVKKKLKVFLIPWGHISEYKDRGDFAREFFETCGLCVIYPNGFENKNLALSETIESDPHIVVLCASDDKYPEPVDFFITPLKRHNKNLIIVLAGLPDGEKKKYKEKGIDEFIFQDIDYYQKLSKLLRDIGVIK